MTHPQTLPMDLITWAGGTFLYGTCYYPDHWPEAMWRRDAEMMQAAGFNLIKTGESAWGTFERSEGVFDFDWLDRAIALFAEFGIRFILGTPSYSPPGWLFTRYPDVAATDWRGVRYRFGERQVHNLSSPDYQAAVRRIVTEMGRHYADNPNVLAFSIDNEIGGQFSYDDLTRGDFIDWLKRRYGTIEQVSETWGGAFWGMHLSDWDQVPIPWNDEAPNPSMALDFRRFHGERTNDFIAMQAAILQEVAPTKATTHNGMGIYDNVDYSRLFEPLSFAAWDHYPFYASQSFAEYFSGDIGNDITRGAKQQNFMVMEQAMGIGAWEKYFSMTPAPPLFRVWTYQAIAHGADVVTFYRWRQNWFGTEQLTVGILNWDSYAGERYEVVSQVGKELPIITELLQGSTVESEAAILLSPDSRWVFKDQPHTEKFSYDALVIDYYRALRQLRINVDVVFPQQDLSRYKLIVAPALLVVDSALGQRLDAFVQEGGTLVLTYLSGFKDDRNWDTGTTLPGLFRPAVGAAIRDFDPQIKQDQAIAMTDGTEFPAEVWYDILTPDSAEILARYTSRYYAGKAAVTRNRHGRGTAYYVGTKTSSEAFYQRIVAAALGDAGIVPGDLVPAGVQVASRRKGDTTIHFVLNYDDQPKTVSMGEFLVDALTGQPEAEVIELEPYAVRVLRTR